MLGRGQGLPLAFAAHVSPSSAYGCWRGRGARVSWGSIGSCLRLLGTFIFPLLTLDVRGTVDRFVNLKKEASATLCRVSGCFNSMLVVVVRA